jgi:hypothetical protein
MSNFGSSKKRKEKSATDYSVSDFDHGGVKNRLKQSVLTDYIMIA